MMGKRKEKGREEGNRSEERRKMKSKTQKRP